MNDMLASFLSFKPEFEILAMDASDCRRVAEVHAERFSRPWNDGEFDSLLTQENVFGYVARQRNTVFGKPVAGFVLAREVAGEAEILTIAVGTKYGRFGLGWRLMLAALHEANRRGGEAIFLEVDDTNAAALALYRKMGFQKVGERPAYYSDPKIGKTSALVMRRDLR
jgi:[ribosomal protein S18]-alanine N-acetyltransferase